MTRPWDKWDPKNRDGLTFKQWSKAANNPDGDEGRLRSAWRQGEDPVKHKVAKKKRTSRSGLAGTPTQHEIEAFKHMTALPVTCGEKGLVALLNVQTALVHAHESGNVTLAARALKRRNEVLKKLERCMR